MQLQATQAPGVWCLPQPMAYEPVWQAMRDFTELRDEHTLDQVWVLQHLPVYTQGQAGKIEHVLNAGHIPIVKTDRGGQVTYHGPGQGVVYVLADLKRTGLNIRAMVQALEQAVIDVLADSGLPQACRRQGAPGVYLPQDDSLAKIAALGIKVRKGCTYHGVALNVDMDLTPFEGINPCGYEGLITTSMAQAGLQVDCDAVAFALAGKIIEHGQLRVE